MRRVERGAATDRVRSGGESGGRGRSARWFLAIVLGSLPGAGRAGQDEPAAATPTVAPVRPAVPCAVPDPADRPPLTDGTDGTSGTAIQNGVEPDPEFYALAAALDQVATAFAACLSSGNYRLVAELATGRHLGYLAGTGGVLTPETYAALAGDLPVVPVGIRSVQDVRLEEPDAASADVVYVVANQLVHGRWAFVRAPESAEPIGPASDATDPSERTPPPGPGDVRWLIDGETPLPVAAPAGAVPLEVELDEYEIDLERERVSQAAAGLQLSVANTGEREHEFLVLRLSGDARTDELLQQPGPRLPDGFAFAGQVTVPAGGQAELILVDLRTGRYALVSLLPDENGVPDLARGMEAQLRIG